MAPTFEGLYFGLGLELQESHGIKGRVWTLIGAEGCGGYGRVKDVTYTHQEKKRMKLTELPPHRASKRRRLNL